MTRSLKYVDFYISDSYLSFIKLFNSNDFDDATLQMCRLYMEVLIQFSKIKQQSVRMKISQLRIMDFLANQIDLEYQMTLLTDESASQAPEKYSSLSAVTEDIAMRRSPRPQVRFSVYVFCLFSQTGFSAQFGQDYTAQGSADKGSKSRKADNFHRYEPQSVARRVD